MHNYYKDSTLIAKIASGKWRSIPTMPAAVLAVGILFILWPAQAFAQIDPQCRINVSEMELSTDEKLEFRDLVLFMPLDDSVLNALGADLNPVLCNGECFEVTAYGVALQFQVGSDEVLIDGKRSVNAAETYIIEDIYYVPAEAFFQALELQTSWDEEKCLLMVDYMLESKSAQERLAEILNLKPVEEISKKKDEAAPSAAVAEPEAEIVDVFIDYTYENTTKIETLRVGGDKRASRKVEVGDYYNSFNLRLQGLLRNGYNFQAKLRTQQTTEPDKNRGGVKKLEMVWSKNKIKMSLYNVQPKFGRRFIMRNYAFQGLSYQRTTNDFTWYAAAGKAPKRMRRSLYARYVGSFRIEKNISDRKDAVIGASYARVRDTGNRINLKKQENFVAGIDLKTKIGKGWTLKGEVANSYNKVFGLSSTRGNANLYGLNYVSKKTSIKTKYEKTSSDFYSETASFTRGRTEASFLYNKRLGRSSTFGAGAKNKKVRGRTTKSYPLSLSLRPWDNRDNFKVSMKRNFEKTSGKRKRIIDNKEVKLRDQLGSSRVDVTLSRQKNKVPGKQLAYRNKKSLVVKSALSEKFGSQLKMNIEKWQKDRVSVARRSGLKIDYEPRPWTEIVLDFGRYYKTPKSARTTSRLTYHKVDIFNDREWRFEYKYENYRDYNVNSVSMSYSFFK